MLTLRQLFLNNNAQTTHFPLLLEFERAEGVYMYDSEGKAYTDLISGIGVSNLGHSNPKVVQAVKNQVDKYMHLMVYGEYVQTPQVCFAQKLVSILPKTLNSVYFTNSGSEAVEGALKLAKRFTGRQQMLAFKGSYHGSTHGALSVMGNEEYKQAYRPLLPGINFMSLNNLPDLELITEQTACVILETIQGEAGIRVPDVAYMQALRKRCTDVGALLILDEIQAAFGRTGKLFAFEHFDIVPDILLLAKALGGGMPVGAFVSSAAMMSVFKENPILGHITTFGGHPVCCAAGLAALEVLLDENLIDRVAEKEVIIREHLVHPAIKQIRGKGLMLAAEFESFELNKKIIDTCIENGVITDWFLHCSNSMRLAPPLIITNEQLINACNIITQAIDFHTDNLQ
ncbi:MULTISPECIES: aspartate aminotransferase family protein [unclassified Mucilaginibacter]|uniref:aspartate aminotransferase family protein n=1 Tax=unclassified Mucilaginibacter TaxID=2617802 RepID=UPI002AC8A82B|nr:MULTISPECIES: aspartate aminotransferase family protein [unclassified Mucilaginibacter]MEB0261285.1 aspartate aminotransferase family protein [Mucilaginibacter sp. 10I4]MEB0280452.1 aspartate aminotransferase family protein [Mucilaginibacter sp. 10B2]MEB0300438.1 aspartate aminotransferase family protein [Mucilaginibacter sp. 5C4]WPX23127.1 aspartate aminotransferase family protein [Mucilaginibacter sp. 5C4]